MRPQLRKITLYNIGKNIYRSLGRIRRQFRNYFKPTSRILLYHRIAEPTNDNLKLCVSPNNFREQIKFLTENFKIIPLVKLVQDIRKGTLENNTVVITFDDGYADNLQNALPILEEFKVPATVFIAAGYIGKNAYIWDENSPQEAQGRPMTHIEVKQLSNSRLIELGGHTISHPNLAKITKNDQFKEISGGKKIFEELLDIPLLSFAYPFGSKDSFTKETTGLVKKAGFHYACSNIHERVTSNSDIYALPRFIVRNWNAEELRNEIKKWL